MHQEALGFQHEPHPLCLDLIFTNSLLVAYAHPPLVSYAYILKG